MTTTRATPTPTLLLTIEGLAARWGVSEDTIREHIKHDGLPFIPLGRGGKRPVYRFRLAAIEAWEARREKHIEGEEQAAPAVPPPAVAAVWDGKDRLGGMGKGKKARVKK